MKKILIWFSSSRRMSLLPPHQTVTLCPTLGLQEADQAHNKPHRLLEALPVRDPIPILLPACLPMLPPLPPLVLPMPPPLDNKIHSLLCSTWIPTKWHRPCRWHNKCLVDRVATIPTLRMSSRFSTACMEVVVRVHQAPVRVEIHLDRAQPVQEDLRCPRKHDLLCNCSNSMIWDSMIKQRIFDA